MNLCFPKAALDQHLIALGKTGAGKSSALRHIVEYLLAQHKRVSVIDPKGDWYGLKSSADGKGPGFPVILFGAFKDGIEPDVPLNEMSGRSVAELIASGNRPCVIGLRGWTHGAMTRFWIDFASTVFNSESGELYLVIDEVHNFAPKGKIMSPEAGKCLHWTNRLVNEGRGLGLVCLCASQRPQKVHNDTLTACETLIAMRVIHSADREAIEEWIKGCGDKSVGAQVLNELANLSRGQAFVWSPEIQFGPSRVKFPMFGTFDSFAPARLQHKVKERGWATVDLVEVRQKLESVIERAKADDPKELRKQIAALKGQISKQSAYIDENLINSQVEKARAEIEKQFEVNHKQLVDRIKALETQIGYLKEYGQRIAAIAEESLVGKKLLPDPAAYVHRLTSLPRPVPTPKPVVKVENNGHLSGPEQRILDAIAWFESLGIQEPEQTGVAFIAGYTVGGGAFNNPRGALRTKGLIEYRGSGLILTDSGRVQATPPDLPATAEALQQCVIERLPGPEQKILKVIIDVYPEPIAFDDLAERSGYSAGGGAFNNPRGRLRTLGLIDYPMPKYAVAKPLLFLE